MTCALATGNIRIGKNFGRSSLSVDSTANSSGDKTLAVFLLLRNSGERFLTDLARRTSYDSRLKRKISSEPANDSSLHFPRAACDKKQLPLTETVDVSTDANRVVRLVACNRRASFVWKQKRKHQATKLDANRDTNARLVLHLPSVDGASRRCCTRTTVHYFPAAKVSCWLLHWLSPPSYCHDLLLYEP